MPRPTKNAERAKRAAKYRAAVAKGAWLKMGHLMSCRVFDDSRSERCNCGKWEAER